MIGAAERRVFAISAEILTKQFVMPREWPGVVARGSDNPRQGASVPQTRDQSPADASLSQQSDNVSCAGREARCAAPPLSIRSAPAAPTHSKSQPVYFSF
jgi:hypothetical protein